MQVLLHVVNLLLGFVVDRKVDDRLMLIPGGLPILAHHDDRGLKRRDERENQIEQDERFWIKLYAEKRQQIDRDLDKQEAREDDDKRPASAK